MLGVDRESEFKFSAEETFVAHLPFLTHDRLMLRVAQGQDLAKSGYSRDHGWQSQVVNQVAIEGKLDEYWRCNSISIEVSHIEIRSPKTITDDRLAPVLENAIAELLPTLDAIEATNSSDQAKCDPEVTLSQGINSVRAMALHKQELIATSHTQILQLNQEIDELNQLILNLGTENAVLHSNSVSLELELSEVRNSISWRLTLVLRLIHRLVKNSAKQFAN